MNKAVYFVSDVHLHSVLSEREKQKRFYLLEFLQQVKKERAELFIVGDLFDFWYEYRHVIPRHFFRVLRRLQEITDDGTSVHLIGGNHDYWLEDFFPAELGVEVHRQPVEIERNGRRFLVTHGDGILKRDSGYRVLRRILRNRFVIRLFRLVHPDLAFEIAKRVSGTSRRYTLRDQDQDDSERAEITAFGREQWQAGFDIVIMGHYHLPTCVREDGKIFINLGDWMRHYTYARFDGANISLFYWDQRPVDPAP